MTDKIKHDAVEAIRQLEMILERLQKTETITKDQIVVLELSLPRIRKYFVQQGAMRGFYSKDSKS